MRLAGLCSLYTCYNVNIRYNFTNFVKEWNLTRSGVKFYSKLLNYIKISNSILFRANFTPFWVGFTPFWVFKFLPWWQVFPFYSILINYFCSVPTSKHTKTNPEAQQEGWGLEPSQSEAESLLRPPNKMTPCTGVYGEPLFWVLVNPPPPPLIWAESPLPPPHFEKSGYSTPLHKPNSWKTNFRYLGL